MILGEWADGQLIRRGAVEGIFVLNKPQQEALLNMRQLRQGLESPLQDKEKELKPKSALELLTEFTALTDLLSLKAG